MYELKVNKENFEGGSIRLMVIIGGVSHPVESVRGEKMESVALRALRKSAPSFLAIPERWEMRDSGGNLVDLSRPVTLEHARGNLFLSPKAGIGA